MEKLHEKKISVIMLTYNREDLVGRAIDSILKQTYKDFEFIIVDNGSNDNSGKIADDYAKNDSRICVIHRERGTIGSGRNTGLNIATGEYIAFIDDDDYIECDYLEFLLNLAVENNAQVAICGTIGRIFKEKIVMTSEESLLELMLRTKYNVGFPTKLLKKELMNGLMFPENKMYDDIVVMHKLLVRANRVVYHGLPKYTVCRHDNNNSAWTTNHTLLTPETLYEYLDAYHVRTDELSLLYPEHSNIFHYYEWSFMISMIEKIMRLGIKNCEAPLASMISELSIHRNEFLNGGYIQDFETEWMEKYV